MGLFTGNAAGAKTKGGLFIFGGIMQYLVLTKLKDETYRVEECVNAPYDIGSPGGELFASQEKIEDNLKSLKSMIGNKWTATVHAGIQSKDVLLRTVELPLMDMEDMKSSFKFEFDKYFPIPVDESVYDIAFIDHPGNDTASQNATVQCVATAMRRSFVENFMTASNKVGLKLASIEPAPVAMLRCLMGPNPPSGFNIYALVGALSSMIVATFMDNGVIYRNTTQSFVSKDTFPESLNFFAGDMQSTIAFASAQMHGFAAEKIYIGGYGAYHPDEFSREIARVSSSPVEIVNPWELWKVANPPSQLLGWEIPLGLALRPMGVE